MTKPALRAMLSGAMGSNEQDKLNWAVAVLLVVVLMNMVAMGHAMFEEGAEVPPQSKLDVAAPSLQVRRDGSIVAEVPQVCARFVVWYGANPPPKEDMWLVMTTQARGDRALDTAEEVVAYFRSMPPERRSAGIFITQDYTHLRHPDLLPPWVS